MPQKIYLYILKGGILASFLSFLFTFSSLLFPYITSKQIYFNILIEVLFILWIAFVIKYRQWRPKLSYICYGLLAYFAVILASCFASADFNLSFWGDIERMLGFFHLAHFLAFYFIVITVMREWKDWRLLFITSLAVTFIVAVKAIVGPSESTIGNRAYVAGLLIFNIYFSLILLVRDSRNAPWRVPTWWLYLLPLPVLLWAFVEQNIAGAIAGLGASIIVLVFFLGALNPRKRVRTAVFVVFALGLVLGAGAAVKNKQAISGYFASEDTFQTRLISWEGAWKDMGNHPLLGTGYGTFAITFDKHFDADFYNYAMHDATFFDRAHNNLVDIASTTGILGVIAYLSIFLALLYYLIINYRQGRINYMEFSLVMAVTAGYFIQNLAVFDSLVTYVSLFSLLGFVYWFHTCPDIGKEKELIAETGDKKLLDKEIYTLAGVGIIVFVIMFQYNIQTWRMLTATIAGQKAFAQNDILQATEEYKRGLGYGSPLNRDSRGTYVDSVISDSHLLQRLSKDKQEEIINYAIELAEANTSYNPEDTIMQMKLARANHLAARLSEEEGEEFKNYIKKAMEASERAIASSPERITTHLLKAQILITAGNMEEAINTIEYTLELNDNYYDSYCYLARLYLEQGNTDKTIENADQCINKGGAKALKDPSVVKQAINHYLAQSEPEKAIVYYEQLARLDGKNPEVWERLAKLYATQGENARAREAARRAIELDSDLAEELRLFIRQLDQDHQFEISR